MADFNFNWLALLPLAYAVIVLIVGAIVVKVILGILKKALAKTSLDEALHTFVMNVVKVALWLIIIVTVLGQLGVPTSTFVAVIGACGAAIALALKDSLSNVAGGILILINRPFRKGDYIEVAGTAGSVDKIDLMTTTLKSPDNKVITIPNGSISTSVLTNFSREDLRRVDCDFGIGYENDIEQARKVILEVAGRNSRILTQPATVVVVTAHGDNCVDLQCRAWSSSADYWDVKFYLEEEVKNAFDAAGINIPYPQVDVHMINQ